jgi:hypothetical protein
VNTTCVPVTFRNFTAYCDAVISKSAGVQSTPGLLRKALIVHVRMSDVRQPGHQEAASTLPAPKNRASRIRGTRLATFTQDRGKRAAILLGGAFACSILSGGIR